MLRAEDGALVMHIDNAAKLKQRALNIPGYQIAMTQRAGTDENAIELRLSARGAGLMKEIYSNQWLVLIDCSLERNVF